MIMIKGDLSGAFDKSDRQFPGRALFPKKKVGDGGARHGAAMPGIKYGICQFDRLADSEWPTGHYDHHEWFPGLCQSFDKLLLGSREVDFAP